MTRVSYMNVTHPKAKAKREDDMGAAREMDIFALIRPRGGDFHYSKAEIKVHYAFKYQSQVSI